MRETYRKEGLVWEKEGKMKHTLKNYVTFNLEIIQKFHDL